MKVIEEYRNGSNTTDAKNPLECYYLFELNNDAACTVKPTHLNPSKPTHLNPSKPKHLNPSKPKHFNQIKPKYLSRSKPEDWSPGSIMVIM